MFICNGRFFPLLFATYKSPGWCACRIQFMGLRGVLYAQAYLFATTTEPFYQARPQLPYITVIYNIYI